MLPKYSKYMALDSIAYYMMLTQRLDILGTDFPHKMVHIWILNEFWYQSHTTLNRIPMLPKYSKYMALDSIAYYMMLTQRLDILGTDFPHKMVHIWILNEFWYQSHTSLNKIPM